MVSFQSSFWISLLSSKQHHTLHSLFLALLICPNLHTTHGAEGSSFQCLLFSIYKLTAETALASSEQPQRLWAGCRWWWCSVPKPCLALCKPMDCSTPGFPVLHHLLEFAQTHVHWMDDAIQQSHPLLPPSPLALSLSQHQGLSQWVSSSHQVAKVLG